MSAPREVIELVERFDLHAESYRSGQYNETQLRREFLDPLFACLGWDVNNKEGLAEAYKDVIHEDQIKVGGATKAPDYCFRVGGTRKFFVEAKKPAVNIKDEVEPAYQLRRYAWSAKLPLSILTDFEEFAVYDCRIKPAPTDKPSVGRILLVKYDEYSRRWDEIAARFSRDAVLKGFFDKYAETTKAKRGTAEVDAAFLEDIESWRLELARNLALRNPGITQRELNFAVQRTIDRIIFLRIAEDRGIEDHGKLSAATNGEQVYARLCELFERADERYNSGLFHFLKERDRAEPPDELTLGLKIDDDKLRAIIHSLYYPQSPYEFSVLPADILGQVYEQFLGKVIRLTAGHQAKVEDKPEVKKAGGVYYTPTYIVEYIVKQTVGRLLEGKAPRHAAKLRVLDPACGSGSFLIGAYQYLLDWHREWYVNNGPKKHAKEIYQAQNGWRLTIAERKRILLANIYGVDIDSQAVETTKLSLLLKVLEGANRETLDRQWRVYHQRALPDLGNNIKCGNSLIGPDFYNGQQISLYDEEDRLRVNIFDWQAEFAEVMKAGGFDAVIGNPPYVRQESLKEIKGYLNKRFRSFESTADLYVYFIERAISLLRRDGLFSFIVSNGFLRTNFGAPLRAFIRNAAALLELVDFGGLPVFEAAKDTYVCVPLIGSRSQPENVSVAKVQSLDTLNLLEFVATSSYPVPISRFTPDAWRTDDERVAKLFDKLKSSTIPLGAQVQNKIFLGVKTGLNEAFEIDAKARKQFIRECPACDSLVRPFLGGQDIRRYFVRDSERYLIAIPNGWTRQTMPGTRKQQSAPSEREAWKWFSKHFGPLADHLQPFTEAARKRQDQGEFWWELRPCDYYDVLDGSKIVYPDIAKEPRFFLDTAGTYIRNTAYCLGTANPYLLGLLNSRLTWFAIARISIPFGTRAGEYRYRLFTQYIEQIPIRPINFADKKDKARHDRMVELVEPMLTLNRQMARAKTAHERTAIERQIEATDHQIDKLVYDLYGLTEKEIGIVEAATT